jgi:hypothetical protein
MLHQAVEHICSVLINTSIGYRVTTHNLQRLLSLLENMFPGVAEDLLGATVVEQQLFNLLNDSYSEVRYNEAFEVTPAQVETLYSRVSILVNEIRGYLASATPGASPT